MGFQVEFLEQNMPRKILIGFGVDVDAVAGWYVRIPIDMVESVTEDWLKAWFLLR